MQSNQQLAIELLARIQDYFPIGLPHMIHEYRGFEIFKKILLELSNAAVDDTLNNWEGVVNAAKSDWEGHFVHGSAGLHFPSYELLIHLYSKDSPAVKIEGFIVANVSAVVDYYTVFVYHEYTYYGREKSTSVSSPRCIYSVENYHMDISAKVDVLKQRIHEFVPNFRFANHEVLFSHKILGGYSYGCTEAEMNTNVIYDFLFSNSMLGREFLVLD